MVTKKVFFAQRVGTKYAAYKHFQVKLFEKNYQNKLT